MHNFHIPLSITPETKYAFKYFLNTLKDNHEDKAIQIYINSFGGDTKTSLWIVRKLIKLQKKGYYIHTIGQDKIASNASIIFICGDKRTLIKDSKILFHRTGSNVSIQKRLFVDSNLKQFLSYTLLKKKQKNLRKENKFIINLIFEKTEINKELFFELEDKKIDTRKALELNIATEVI